MTCHITITSSPDAVSTLTLPAGEPLIRALIQRGWYVVRIYRGFSPTPWGNR